MAILAERILDVESEAKQHWQKAVLWPSGDLVITKRTKRTTLTLSNPAKLHKSRAKRGQKGLTPYAARVVRSAATYLEEKYNRTNLSFITTTVPDLPEGKLELLIEKWGVIQNRFLQELKRQLIKEGVRLEYVVVTEIQEKRWLKTGKAYPHLHVLLRGRLNYRQPWILTQTSICGAWTRVLRRELDITFSQTPRVSVERIRKSACGYISKYLSKGSASLSRLRPDIPTPPLPCAWHGLSRSILAYIKARTLVVRDSDISGVVSRLHEWGTIHNQSCLRISLFDEKTGFSWPIGLMFYIWDKHFREYVYDCLRSGQHTK